MFNLIALAQLRLQEIVAGKQFQAPGGGSDRLLEVYTIDLPIKLQNQQNPEGIPYALIVPGEGSGGAGMTQGEVFGVQFVFFASTETGERDDLKGCQYVSDTHQIMEQFYTPLDLGSGWQLQNGFGKFYGQDGMFRPPYYSVQYPCTAIKRSIC